MTRVHARGHLDHRAPRPDQHRQDPPGRRAHAGARLGDDRPAPAAARPGGLRPAHGPRRRGPRRAGHRRGEARAPAAGLLGLHRRGDAGGPRGRLPRRRRDPARRPRAARARLHRAAPPGARQAGDVVPRRRDDAPARPRARCRRPCTRTARGSRASPAPGSRSSRACRRGARSSPSPLPEVYALAERLRARRGGAAVVLGALSPRTRNAQVAIFQAGEVDYLVATDAIGMGLNLDVGHVAFASLRKFDGREARELDAAELAQIAGRAGRHLRDGTFGTVAPLRLPEPVAAAVETHRFPPVRRLRWRNADLDLASVEALLASLRRKPPRPLPPPRRRRRGRRRPRAPRPRPRGARPRLRPGGRRAALGGLPRPRLPQAPPGEPRRAPRRDLRHARRARAACSTSAGWRRRSPRSTTPRATSTRSWRASRPSGRGRTSPTRRAG